MSQDVELPERMPDHQTGWQTTFELRYDVLTGGRKKCVVTTVRCIRTENFSLREIGT